MKSSELQESCPVYFLFICLALLFPAKVFAAYTFSIDSTHIQSALLMHFPVREYTAAARLTLTEPTVILKRDADNLQLDIPVIASIPGEGRRRGLVVVDVGLHYKPSTGELFLGIPKIRRFNMQNIVDENQKTFHASLADVLVKTLPLVRIHRVREEDLNHSLSMSRMKSIHVGEGRVQISIGFD